jgi:hypothetical protein
MRDNIKRMNWNEWIQHFYYGLMYASYALYVIAMLGIASVAPTYLSTVHLVLKYFIIVFLMVRFNPWTRHEAFTAFDRTIVFSAALFLLTTTAITSIVLNKLHLRDTY